MRFLLAALVLLACAGCGNDTAPPTAEDGIRSAVTGQVLLGPQCPVEAVGEPCDPAPATGVTVTVSEQLPGEAYAAGPTVAEGVTDSSGRFRITLAPGDYVVTADAGMFCELMDVSVVAGEDAVMDVPCDTGIR
ncbi:carboxypeptidase-like regulatory domain-containing protein [Nocardioides psychrotolerans]|uniref:carboxypeptidase-like regulatory domain-containing protein n=1 Tax=Nocardioides psychrotolerans TaxID=1005945 RepID=UPI0031377B09